MPIQSLSVVVPNPKCVNNCKFCCSKMHANDYENLFNGKYDLESVEGFYLSRLNYVRSMGCDTVILTGNTEPQMNLAFIYEFFKLNTMVKPSPFNNIEIQTTGTTIDRGFLDGTTWQTSLGKKTGGLTTISLSISSFDDDENNEIIGTVKDEEHYINLKKLSDMITSPVYALNLRFSLNMLNTFDKYFPKELFDKVKSYGANEVIFRKLWVGTDFPTAQAKYINEHNCRADLIPSIKEYVKTNGRFIEYMEDGRARYSVDGISTVIDEDSMASAKDNTCKYYILRPNCHLYAKWDDKGSIVF
jgi:hypothetical protein